MVIAAAKIIQPLRKYENLEMNWIGDFNLRMIHVVETLETQVIKRYRTYRYLFDPAKPFKRYPMLN